MKPHLPLLFVTVALLQVWPSLGLDCENRSDLSGSITYSRNGPHSYCWNIQVPEGSYTSLNIQQLSIPSSCFNSYVQITAVGTGETFTYCSDDTKWKPITAISDVKVTVNNQYRNMFGQNAQLYLTFSYSTESLICAQKNHFRCSKHSCIHQYQVCNGVKDCENGADEVGCETGIAAVKGVNTSRENAIKWLKDRRSAPFGWGRNTHRAVIALYLGNEDYFNGNDLEAELIVKELELQTAVALLRNSSDPLSVTELSMFINALSATCHNFRRFYGYDLLQTLGEQTASMKTVSPSAYLTLCNANWTISESHIRSLMHILHKSSEYPFISDVQAMTVLALTCIKNRTKAFDNIENATRLYNSTLNKYISNQLSDGSFGNAYTTALVTQALLAGGQEYNKRWNLTSTILYLMRQLNSSSNDFLLTYFTLPIFSGKTLVDVATVNCSKSPRNHGKDDEISDVLNKLGGKMRIQFSLYIGDKKDIIHTIYLRVPENSSVHDVMRVAQVADPKYKFKQNVVSGHLYIYEIDGITNDPELGMFWLIYIGDSNSKDNVRHHSKSPDKLILKDKEHLIMWYKTFHI